MRWLKKAMVIAALIAVFMAQRATADHLNSEKFYQERWCAEAKGQIEVTLPDQTRCDCLTRTNAVEVDFASKWTEAIGQSLYYAIQTGKRAGIVLILEDASDRKYWIRLNTVIEHYRLPIDTWEVHP